MKHFSYENERRIEKIFFKKPESFTKHSDKDLLAYALGATLYMPATKSSIATDILSKKYRELASLVIDLEDAVSDNQLEEAEQTLYKHMKTLYFAIQNKQFTLEELPLLFIRVRNPKQMKRITESLGVYQQILTGYVFPKFSYENGKEYLAILKENNTNDITLYGMPILESADVIYKESRMQTLMQIKELLDTYHPYILNVRIGATDFCGLYGIRRKADTTIYDVSIIRDCISDILNLFCREYKGYVVSGPVWEFFSKEQRVLKPTLRMTPFADRSGQTGISKRKEMINQYIDGLLNEVVLDKLNGIVGKTIIHPTHIKAVHSMYTVTHEEYMDALLIIENSNGQAGVLKSAYNNKMNEIKPHLYWAQKTMLQARVFGVFNEDEDFTSLIISEQPVEAEDLIICHN